MKNIKVNFVDGDYLFTTINGSESEISVGGNSSRLATKNIL